MPRKTTPLLSEAIAEYLEIRESHVARTTHVNERIQLRLFLKGVGDCRVAALTPQAVERYFIAESKRQAAASYNKVRQRVKGFLGFCVTRGWLDRDPLAMVRPRKVTHRERLRLSPEELVELPDYAHSPRDRAILVLACNSALRADEIRNLRVKDLDLAGGWFRVQITKSGKEDLMPITQELGEELREWVRRYEAQTGPLQPEWYLFPSRKCGNGSGVYLLNPEKPVVKMAAVVQKAMEDAGHMLERGEGIHTLRRSVARAFFDSVSAAGHDSALRMTSALLHHSSTQVTEIYLGLQHERLSRDEVMRGKSFLPTMLGSAVRHLEAS